jgi:transposase-like protein
LIHNKQAREELKLNASEAFEFEKICGINTNHLIPDAKLNNRETVHRSKSSESVNKSPKDDDDKPFFGCNECNKVFTTRNGLSRHLDSSVHQKSECKEYNKCFTENALNIHIESKVPLEKSKSSMNISKSQEDLTSLDPSKMLRSTSRINLVLKNSNSNMNQSNANSTSLLDIKNSISTNENQFQQTKKINGNYGLPSGSGKIGKEEFKEINLDGFKVGWICDIKGCLKEYETEAGLLDHVKSHGLLDGRKKVNVV